MADDMRSPSSRAMMLETLRVLLQRCPQKKRIAHGVSEGLTNRQIGDRLGRSEHTVHTLLSQIYRKAGVQGRVLLGVLVSELDGGRLGRHD